MYTLLLISNKSVLLLHNDKICKFHIYSELVKEFKVVGLPFFCLALLQLSCIISNTRSSMRQNKTTLRNNVVI